MPAEIVRRREQDGIIILNVQDDEITFTIALKPARDMNGKLIGYKSLIGGRAHATAQHAEASAISAIERLHATPPATGDAR